MRSLAILLAVMSTLACTPEYETQAGVASDRLSPSELVRLRGLAEAGDAEAAYRVAVHYEATPETMGEVWRWLALAAHHDHDLATQHLIHHLQAHDDCARSELWLARLETRLDAEGARSIGLEGLQREQRACVARVSEPDAR